MNKESATPWIVVTDFDGTLTVKDIGNELCIEVLGPRFDEIYARYRRGEIDLKFHQKLLWEKFPLTESEFRARALKHAELRPGVEEFLSRCADHKIPVYVASCGLRPYIDEVLKNHLSRKALSAIAELRCNEAVFDDTCLAQFIPPQTSAECPYPLDKGAWASEVRTRHAAGTRMLGIGNGTSDRSFVGHVDVLAATESLAEWCRKNQISFVPFEDFTELQDLELFCDS
jgi:2,3-diketo-5-methylthio-1-phosphopentane phosphatase